MYIKDIEEACRKVLQGDNKALQELGLDSAKYPKPKPQNTSRSSLQINYNATLNTAVAARELQLAFVEKQCELTMQYIQAIAAPKKITLEHSVDAEDVAEIMLALIDEEKRKYWTEGDENQATGSKEEEEDESEQSEKEEDVVDEGEQEKDQADEGGKDEEVADEHIVRPKKRKPVLHISEESEGEESQEDSEEAQTESEDSKQETREETPAIKKAKKTAATSISHHLERRCVVGHGCNYQGPNLKRHLTNVHVRKEHIHQNQVNKYFAMGLQGHKKRGPIIKTKSGKKLKGRWKRWCPQPGCHYLGSYLPQHLENKHRMKPSSSLYKTTLKIAVKYRGVQEEVEQLSKSLSTRRKRFQPDESSEEEAIPPTPPKRKRQADNNCDATSVAAEANTLDNPSKTSSAASKASAGASTTSSEASNTCNPPAVASTSQLSEPCTREASGEDDSDVDESSYGMAADFFEEKNPKTNRHKWLCFFYCYLFTPTAGFHKDRNRLQHACQVKKLIEETDPKGDDILFIVEDEGNRVWVDWVIPNLKKKKAGTLKSYLTSFEMFLEYVSKKGKRPHLPVIDMEIKNKLFDLCNGLKKWRRCITKETTSAKWDRYLNESDHLLTNDEVEDILSSKPTVDGRAALVAADQAKSIDDLSIKQYVDARDLLVTTLTRAVGTRPAALENATIEMFNKAQWDDGKRKKVIMVSSHKQEEDGPAPIPMSPDTEFLMNTFIEKLRPLVTDDTSPKSKIFLKNDGAPFQKGTIGRRVRAFVVKSGIRPDKVISATDFRKWIVTELKRKKRMGIKIDEQLLRRLMCHSDRTANEWYLRESLTQEAAEASVLIEEYTQPTKSNSQPSLPAPFPNQDGEETCAPQEIQTNKPNSVTSGSSDKTCLSVAQRDQVDKIFADDIKSGIEPWKKRVVALMKCDIVLRSLVNSQPHVKRVIDRVRYLFDSRPQTDPFELPEESPEARTASFVTSIPERPPSSIESGRVEWSSDETEAIREALTFWQKLPSKQQIQQMFSKSQVLRDIFRNNDFERIRNKVKNEYRKMK